MKNLNKNFPVLGWIDISECKCYEQMAEDLIAGAEIIYNTLRNLDDDQTCAFVIFDDYSQKTIHSVLTGKPEFIGRHINHLAPITYRFSSEKQVELYSVEYCKCCGEPSEITLSNENTAGL